MVFSQFFSKIDGVHFCKFAHENRDWDKRFDNSTRKVSICKLICKYFSPIIRTGIMVFFHKVYYGIKLKN